MEQTDVCVDFCRQEVNELDQTILRQICNGFGQGIDTAGLHNWIGNISNNFSWQKMLSMAQQNLPVDRDTSYLQSVVWIEDTSVIQSGARIHW